MYVYPYREYITDFYYYDFTFQLQIRVFQEKMYAHFK